MVVRVVLVVERDVVIHAVIHVVIASEYNQRAEKLSRAVAAESGRE